MALDPATGIGAACHKMRSDRDNATLVVILAVTR